MGTFRWPLTGWQSVPKEKRFPIALGVPPSLEKTISKKAGLTIYISVGLWFSALSMFAASTGNRSEWFGAGFPAFFLLMEMYTIRRLRR